MVLPFPLPVKYIAIWGKGLRVLAMELTIRYAGRKIGFFWEGAKGAEQIALGLPEHTVRKIRAAGGHPLDVMAAKVGAALRGHVWPQSTSVWVEQDSKRLIACPA